MGKIRKIFDERLAGIKEYIPPKQKVGIDDLVIRKITDSETKRMFSVEQSLQDEMDEVMKRIVEIISTASETDLNQSNELEILSQKMDVLESMFDLAHSETQALLVEDVRGLNFNNVIICEGWNIVEVDGKKRKDGCQCALCKITKRLGGDNEELKGVRSVVENIVNFHNRNN